MTIGLPVIAANRGALPEVLGDAGVLFDAEDPEALACGLDRLLGDRRLAHANVCKGIERSRQFRWEATAARVRNVYQLAVQRRAGRR
jgi:glycosyltransferase involved in cell wall biosynthesis